MLQMPCQMQKNAQRKLYICYKGAPTHPTQEIKHTPSSPRKRVKVAWSRGSVKISASWSCVGTWIKAIFPFSTLSLKKWYLTSMCFVLECSTGFFATCWRIKDVSLYDLQAYRPTSFSPRDSQGSCQSAEQGDYKRSIYLYTLATQTLTMIKLENN
jgi:hypothetical protein